MAGARRPQESVKMLLMAGWKWKFESQTILELRPEAEALQGDSFVAAMAFSDELNRSRTKLRDVLKAACRRVVYSNLFGDLCRERSFARNLSMGRSVSAKNRIIVDPDRRFRHADEAEESGGQDKLGCVYWETTGQTWTQ